MKGNGVELQGVSLEKLALKGTLYLESVKTSPPRSGGADALVRPGTGTTLAEAALKRFSPDEGVRGSRKQRCLVSFVAH